MTVYINDSSDAASRVNSATSLIAHLHRGGSVGNFWHKSKASRWYDIGGECRQPVKADSYFGVHPCTAIPPTNGDGEPTTPDRVRSQTAYIAAINCLFAEFDAKDARFDGSKAAIEAHLQGRAMLWPTVIVDSGGGLHCYWLLDKPHLITDDAERTRIKGLQARFVAAIAGDAGAKDLARVLRVPGTLNTKYDPPRPVTIIEDWRENAIYSFDELTEFTRHMEAKFAPKPEPTVTMIEKNLPTVHDVETHGVAGILATLAAQGEGNRNNLLYWASKRLQERDIPRTHAETLLLPIASAIGLPESDSARTIQSAYAGGAR